MSFGPGGLEGLHVCRQAFVLRVRTQSCQYFSDNSAGTFERVAPETLTQRRRQRQGFLTATKRHDTVASRPCGPKLQKTPKGSLRRYTPGHDGRSSMRAIAWFLAEVLRLLLEFALTACLELLRCAVRLLYWTVRRYGWGRVGTFFGVALASLYLHAEFGGATVTAASLASVTLSTLAVWAAVWYGGLWLAHRGRRRLNPATPTGPSPVCHSASAAPTATMNASSSTAASPLPPPPPPTAPSPPTASPPGGEIWGRIVSLASLQEAWRRVLSRNGGPGPDGTTIELFALDAERRLQVLAEALARGQYSPAPPRWVEVPKRSGGTRKLGILSVQDRIVQQAIQAVCAPLWDRRLAPCSFAYRPGRSALQAVAAVEQVLALGRVWVVDADIEAFFDSVPHSALFAVLQDWVPDERARQLVERCVIASSPAQGRGLAQGAPLSPLLANLYLDRFDRALLQAGHRPLRYADDFVILCATRQEAEAVLATARRLLDGLGLRLNAEKTRIVHRDEGFTFLGYVFSRDGKRPSEHAIASLNARLAAASGHETRRQIVAGWQGYFGEGAATPASSEPHEVVPGDEPVEALGDAPWWGGEDGAALPDSDKPADPPPLAEYRERFLGRPDVFACHWERGGRQGYLPIRRPVTDREIEDHLAGRIVLGTYLLHPDGTTRALVLDIDGPSTTEAGRATAFQAAHRLATALQKHGIAPVWVDSGGKGYHLWLCFSASVPAKAVRQWATGWLDRFRPFPEGVLVEVFPKQDGLAAGALGALIRLPLGRHPETGRPSVLLSMEGQSLADPWPALAAAPLLNPEALHRAAEGPREPGSWPDPPEAVAPLVRGCALVGALVRKAAESRHLRHTERLALLYTLGPLGEAGRTYVHQVIGLCSNYDPRITERWIQRLEPGHRPIKCATLKDWLKDHLPGVTCPCVPNVTNSSPMDLLRQSVKAGRKPPRPSSEGTPAKIESAWEDVAQEMFGEALSSATASSGETRGGDGR